MNRVRSFAASSLLSAALLGGVVGAPLVLAPTAALAQAADNLVHLSQFATMERDMLKDALAIIKRLRQFLRLHFRLDAL